MGRARAARTAPIRQLASFAVIASQLATLEQVREHEASSGMDIEEGDLMKLAEALTLRADLQKRVASVVERAQANALFQEGESPAEDTAALVAQANGLLDELEELIAGINRTNSVTRIGDSEVTITQALARRDVLRARHSVYAKVADAASGQTGMRGVPYARQLRSELKLVSAVDVGELRATADRLAIELRELDARIQETNWSVDLVE